MIPFGCPRCGMSMTTSEDTSGSTVKCPRCLKAVIVPDDEPELGTPVTNQEPVLIRWAGAQTDPEFLRDWGKVFAVLLVLVATMAFVGCGLAVIETGLSSKPHTFKP